jgi:hypothetical protein
MKQAGESSERISFGEKGGMWHAVPYPMSDSLMLILEQLNLNKSITWERRL